MKYLTSIAFLFLFHSVFPQDNSELKNKIDLLISYEEYEMAVSLLDSLIISEPDSIIHLKKMGNCYLGLRNPGLAIPYYKKCLELNPEYAEALYNLGSSYDQLNKKDSAVVYFKAYSRLKKNDPEVYNRLSSIYLDFPDKADSSVFYAKKALAIDPQNLDSYFSLSFAYFNLSKFSESLQTALKGLKVDSGFSLLFLPAGLSSYYLDDPRSAMEYFMRGWNSPGFEEMFANYYAQSIILSNTHPGKYSKEGDKIYFTDIKSDMLRDLIAETQNELSNYYYRTLLIKNKDKLFKMGLDEFIMLYIGFTNDPAYSPYSLDNKKINDLLEKEDYENFILTVEEMIAKTPSHYPLYFYLSEIYKKQGNYQAQLENLIRYFGFSQSILATGSGKSKKEAIIVAFVNHEYEVLAELGLRASSQELLTDKVNYDVLTGIDSLNQVHKIYFNIDMPVNSLKRRREGRNKLFILQPF